MYGLLARLFSRPPDCELLDVVAGMKGDDTEMGKAIGELANRAGAAGAEAVKSEYQDLFIGVGRGELLPYASYYLTGFLNEKPLARLRTAMAELQIARDPSISEPEDHIGALMDMMSGLITGVFSAPADMETQKRFFTDHIANWAPHFFKDLENAKSASFYSPAGTIGRLMMDIEQAAFEMQ